MGKRKLTIREKISKVEDEIDTLQDLVDKKARELVSLMDDVFVLCQQVCDLSYEMLEVENDG